MTSEIIFNRPPRNLQLADGAVHVFCAALDPSPSRLEYFETILSADERARAARFVFAQDRNRFLAGRGMLREILGRLLHADPAQPVFAYGQHGKPRLAGPVDGRFLHFNLAHSDALAIYIVSGQGSVGIDVERVRPVREAEAIMSQFFSARENAEWRALPPARRMEAFFAYWIRKEALLKAGGGSLAARSGSVLADSIHSGFSLHLLTPVVGYQAAAAIKGAGAPHCWGWPAR
ncbi:MAG TPA: 4'-phosphopantetheinyl transferase superfamily protein [Verrucomicrobiae bacterium]|nr:4'-phosphopantetheinyl transferase superfamily protein [Verrucomicrobiae bacterium]